MGAIFAESRALARGPFRGASRRASPLRACLSPALQSSDCGDFLRDGRNIRSSAVDPMYSIKSNSVAPCSTEGPCSGNPFCDSLSCATRELLCRAKTVRTFAKKKESLFGPVAEQRVMLIRKGKILTFRQHRDGRPKGVECLDAGDILGIGSLFKGKGCSPVHFFVKETTHACLLPLELFEEAVVSDPAAARAVIHAAVNRFARAIDQLAHVSLDSSEDKIRFVLEQMFRGNDLASRASTSLTHRELAVFAGVNRITATRMLDRIRCVSSSRRPARTSSSDK